MSDDKSRVFLSLPLPDQQIFRYQAADDILELLFRNPHREFAVTQLRETTGHGGKSVDNAIKILESLDLIQRRKEGRQSLLHINQAQIQKPDDPLLEIRQEEFRTPVREFLEEAKERQGENLVALILFGSVARGEADRASDIDIQVIVKEDLLEARRDLQDVRQKIEETKFDGNRYEIQLLVESVESAESYGEKLQEIFSEGIKLYSTEKLDDVKEAVFNG
jgi:predicted nucleotidyltransferase